MTSLYGIEQERLTQAQEVAAFERELTAERMTERDAEMQAIRDQLIYTQQKRLIINLLEPFSQIFPDLFAQGSLVV